MEWTQTTWWNNLVMFLLGAWFGAGGMAAFLVHLWIKSRERGEDGRE
jgi:hypothetical protein